MIDRPGVRIRQLRKERGLTLKEVASAVGTSIGTIGDLEAGRAKNPRGDTLLALAKFFNVSLSWLQSGKGTKEMPAFDEAEEELLALYRTLSAGQQRQLMKLGEVLKGDDPEERGLPDRPEKPSAPPKH